MRPHHVRDLDIVARLLPVAIDRRRDVLEHLLAEDRHHAGLASRALSRAIDVPVAQHDVRQTVKAVVGVEIVLHHMLANTVRSQGENGSLLGGRQHLRLAVNGSARGGVNKPPRLVLHRQAEKVDRSENVAFGVEDGVLDRPSHVHLGRVVVDHIRLFFLEDSFQRGAVTDVRLMERDGARQVLARTARKVVHDGHLKPLRKVAVHHMRADKARSACHQRFHLLGSSRSNSMRAANISRGLPPGSRARADYSTVTLLARLRGLSTSQPRRTAQW